MGNFEEIILDDELRTEPEVKDFSVKATAGFLDSTYAYDVGNTPKLRSLSVMVNSTKRELVSRRSNTSYPISKSKVVGTSDSLDLNLFPPNRKRVNTSPVPLPINLNRRNQSLSPIRIDPRQSNVKNIPRPKRSIWQINQGRKTVEQLEKECDEDDGDDVPDDCFLENVPISPRRPSSRQSRHCSDSLSISPKRKIKCKSKPLGNGTSAQPAEQGELRSPRSGAARTEHIRPWSTTHDFFKTRAMSWSTAMSDLSQETKELTEALEEYQSKNRESEIASQRPPEKIRVRSAFAELPPLRRTDMMIDPLPISREKEAVLSRTRPSWLPPKNPAEEKRHLREYKKMMAQSLVMSRKKEAEERLLTMSHDDTSSYLLKIWEEDVIPNWDNAIRQKRTKNLWWHGIPSKCRGKVWKNAIGNDLGLSEKSYSAALGRAQAFESIINNSSQLTLEEKTKKMWFSRIENDVKRTFPDLKIFQHSGPLHAPLLDVLKAYTMYRSDIGYVCGTSTSVALLLLNLSTPSDAFITLSNLLNRSLPLAFFTNETNMMKQVCKRMLSILKQKSSKLHSHLTSPNLEFAPESAFRGFFISMGTTNMGLDPASRLWDIMVFEGDNVLINAAATYLINVGSKLFGADSHQKVLDVIQEDVVDVGEKEWINSLRKMDDK